MIMVERHHDSAVPDGESLPAAEPVALANGEGVGRRDDAIPNRLPLIILRGRIPLPERTESCVVSEPEAMQALMDRVVSRTTGHHRFWNYVFIDSYLVNSS